MEYTVGNVLHHWGCAGCTVGTGAVQATAGAETMYSTAGIGAAYTVCAGAT